MIDPIQPQVAAVAAVASADPTRSASAPQPSSAPVAPSDVQKASASTTDAASSKNAPASTTTASTNAPSASDGAQPLRLLIEHDKATDQYVYKLYDSSGRIVREIPQESLADAQKQAGGSIGAVIDTTV